MSAITNKLVSNAHKAILPASIAGAFLLGGVLFAGGGVHAAMSNTPQLDDKSVAALVSLDRAMEAVTSKVTPSIVNVEVTSRSTADQDTSENNPMLQNLPPGFAQFFGQGGMRMQPQRPQLEHGIGSGVIISPDGYIITNNHVVDGATQIKVTLDDRRIFTGKVIGVDKLTDLAVIKINAQGLPAISWGDSTKLQPGETVLAFGSPFGSLRFSVTRGIVSAINRPNPYNDDARKPGAYIQTDAAINPGNSGGALVDAYGQLVGINTFIISNSGSFAGAGFAIPSQIAQATAQQLIAHGKVDHGYLGISMEDVDPRKAHFFNLKDASGAIVAQVTPGSPASNGGVQQGDVIVGYDGHNILNGSQLQVAVSEMRPGTPLNLQVLRDGNPVTLHLTVGEYNAKGQVAANGQDDEGNGQPGGTGKLGLAVANLDDNTRQQVNAPDNLKGVVVENVRPGSPADDAGLQPGDVILQVNRKPASTASQFASQVHAVPQGHDLLLLVWSKGNESYRTLTPADAQDQNGQ
jgi:serine protease Do